MYASKQLNQCAPGSEFNSKQKQYECCMQQSNNNSIQAASLNSATIFLGDMAILN